MAQLRARPRAQNRSALQHAATYLQMHDQRRRSLGPDYNAMILPFQPIVKKALRGSKCLHSACATAFEMLAPEQQTEEAYGLLECAAIELVVAR